MPKRKPKERVIYDNYDTFSMYDEAKEHLTNVCDEEPSDDDIWKYVSVIDADNWENEKENMKQIFDEGNFIAVGTCGSWLGNQPGGFVFNSFDELMNKLVDCEYFKFWDEDGHFYVNATHHDGTHSLEIRELTEKGMKYHDNWYFAWNDKRNKKDVYERLFKDSHYSKLINYAQKMWGCPKRETA